MRIVFMSGGARERTLRHLLENGEPIVAVITPVPTASNSRFLGVIEVAREFGIPVHQVARDAVTGTLRSLDYDLLVSCGFSYLIDREAIGTAKLAINVHPTLLPRYRGFRSGIHILINGEKRSGVTVHVLTEEMDRGDVILQREFEITEFDTVRSLVRKTNELEPGLVLDAVRLIRSNEHTLTPQDESQASEYNAVRTPKDSELDPSRPLSDLYNFIRACDPDDYPAFFFVNGQKVCVKLWRPEKPLEEADLL